MLDDFTTKVVNHLTKSLEDKTPIDANLIDGYILSIDKAITTQEQYFQTIIPLLNQILLDDKYYELDPHGILIDLLLALLSNLSFKQVLTFYPIEFILANLFESNVPVVNILCLKIIILNIHEHETLQFLKTNDVISRLVEKFFTEETPISVLGQIELLLTKLETKEEIASLDPIEPILRKTRKLENTIILARYLDLLNIVLPKLKKLSPALYTFTRDDFFKFESDPLFLVLLVQFYGRLVREQSELELEFVLSEILSSFDKFDSLVKSEVVELVTKISYGRSYTDLLDSYQIFKTHNLIQVFEKNETDIKLLSKANPQVIYDLNNSIYTDVLAHLNLFTNNAYFPILLNFIEPTTTFFQLKLQLDNNRLSRLPMDKLFNLLLVMAKYEHSKEHLFNSLPNIISANLLESDIRNHELWNLKVEILEQLLENQTVPGFDYWHEQLQQNYDYMRFGKSYKNIIPKVDIIDETG
ncbi:DNA mismatch repair protein HSM3 [Candida viswanathii]|uniref:DNA mismatch repair protein HSM3 n=1 Tax=Candida viswanathii TaxID=5486 RepID=A0A367YK75_9ASCO|nr:DNA mismatch repair protein HSM3 [Candida viswanathii]